MPTSPHSNPLQFQIYFGEIVTFYKGPMWASAPTDTFFDTLSGTPGGVPQLFFQIFSRIRAMRISISAIHCRFSSLSRNSRTPAAVTARMVPTLHTG